MLIEYIGRHRPGDKVNILVDRKGKEMSIPVILKNRDGRTGTITKSAEIDAVASLDIQLEEVDGKVLKKLDIDRGVRIKDLGNGKIAKYTEMRDGFIVTKVNDTPVGSVKEFRELINKRGKGDLIILSGTYEDIPREFNYAFRM